MSFSYRLSIDICLFGVRIMRFRILYDFLRSYFQSPRKCGIQLYVLSKRSCGRYLLGVVNNMITVYLVYRLLRRHIHVLAIIIGVLLVIISYVGLPMAFYNDLMTCLLYVLAVFYLFKGLRSNNNLWFIISGIIVALNTFTRIPNVLDYGIILLIILHKLVHHRNYRCYFTNENFRAL